ncbi:hypothetical protein [Flavobacterium sp.]|uniref:hypothetical protein n=1 Tax=Flavobacterium sp. TaxID=239 RepID=UPI003750CEB2
MKVYLDTAFLEAFENDIDTNNQSYKIVFDILTKYPQVKIYSAISDETHENPYSIKNKFQTLAGYYAAGDHIIEIENIEQTLLSNQFDADLIFMRNEKPWFTDAQKNGVLCFSFDNYKDKISKILDDYHYKIDLTDQEYSFNWGKLKFLNPLNHLIIGDNYILIDAINRKKEENLFKLLQEIKHCNNDDFSIDIYTIVQEDKHDKNYSLNQLENKVIPLRNICSTNIINIISVKPIDFHDRVIISNFQLIECGKGFNLIPHKPSNSQIISSTIFELYTYKRMLNLKKAYSNHYEKMKTNNPYFTTIYKV